MRIFGRELWVGVLNGVVLATVLGLGSYAVFRDPKLSATIALAILINLIVAALAGILAPLTLDRLGRDPAVSSSVFVTFVTDFTGFFAFLGLAALILL
jgi:magnesium transporter